MPIIVMKWNYSKWRVRLALSQLLIFSISFCHKYILGYDRCQECRRIFHNIRKHKCKRAQSISLLPQTLMLGMLEPFLYINKV